MAHPNIVRLLEYPLPPPLNPWNAFTVELVKFESPLNIVESPCGFVITTPTIIAPKSNTRNFSTVPNVLPSNSAAFDSGEDHH